MSSISRVDRHQRPFCRNCFSCRLLEAAIRDWAESPNQVRKALRGELSEQKRQMLVMTNKGWMLSSNMARDLEAFGFDVASGVYGFAARPEANIVVEYDANDGDMPATFHYRGQGGRSVSMTVAELQSAYVRMYDLGFGATQRELLVALGLV